MEISNGYFKFASIGDPHFQEQFLNELQIATENLKISLPTNLDFIVVMGDLLHKHDKIDIYSKRDADIFVIELSKRTKTVYILIGNHDRPNESEYLTNSHVFNLLKISLNVIVIDTVRIEYIKSMRNGLYYKFIFVPYVSPDKFLSACASFGLIPPFDDVAHFFGHQEFDGCQINKLSKNKADKWLPEYPDMTSGHIHDYEEVGHNLRYVGSLIQTKYSDICKKSISIITIEPPNNISKELYIENNLESNLTKNRSYITNHERIYLNVPGRFQIDLTPEELENFVLPENCTLKIRLECGSSVFDEICKLDKIKEFKAKGVNIINIDTTKIQYTFSRTEIPNILDAEMENNLPTEKILFENRVRNRIKKELQYVELYQELFYEF